MNTQRREEIRRIIAGMDRYTRGLISNRALIDAMEWIDQLEAKVAKSKESMKHKRAIDSIINHNVWTIMDKMELPIAEIHLGRFTPGKYSVRLRVGLSTFVCDGVDRVKEMETIEEAAETVDLFLDCGAVAAIRAQAGQISKGAPERTEVPAAVVPEGESEHEREVLALIGQRDEWEDLATKLAEKVGETFSVDVGEHSSANCPVRFAIEFLDEKSTSDRVLVDGEVKILKSERRELALLRQHFQLFEKEGSDNLNEAEQAFNTRQEVDESLRQLLRANQGGK